MKNDNANKEACSRCIGQFDERALNGIVCPIMRYINELDRRATKAEAKQKGLTKVPANCPNDVVLD